MKKNEHSPHRRYVPWLSVLLGLFIFRVGAQLLQAIYPVTFLPPFGEWYSGALGYPYLVLSQLLIIWLFVATIAGFMRGTTRPRRPLGRFLAAVGSAYLTVMIVRLIAAFTVAAGHPWWGAKIPAFFHIVLASFILLVAHFHTTCGDEK